MRKKTVLFITHEVSNTGAPILLLNLLEAVKERGEYNILILAVRNGDILARFKDIAPTGYLKSADYRKETSAIKKQWNKLTFAFRLFVHIPMWCKADIVFNNTIGNGKILKYYSAFKKLPVISYIHELASAIEVAEKYGEASITFKLSNLILSPSSFNKNILVGNYGVPQEKVKILPYLILNSLNNSPADLMASKYEHRASLCSTLHIDTNTRLVLGMGTFDKRKGSDLFIRTAEKLKDKNIFFVWIGQNKEQEFFQEMMAYVKEKNITNFHYAGSKPHNFANYLPFDILYLSSREDPYPLVVLEAAMVGIPTVCFKRSGGIIDFVTPDSGWVIDELSIDSAATEIANINETELSEKGQRSKVKVMSMHLDSNHIYSFFKGYISGILPEAK